MPHSLEALRPRIPGSAFIGNALELRPGGDFLTMDSDALVWTSGEAEYVFTLDRGCIARLAASLRAAGIENTLDAK